MTTLLHTRNYRQYCHVVNAAQHCRLFQDPDFVGDLEDTRSQHRVEFCAYLEVVHCSHQLDMREANTDISQFHRIGIFVVGCWIANVWTEHPHSAFFSNICTLSSLCTHHIVAQGVAQRVCMKLVQPHVITCLSVCCFLLLSSSSVSRASTFSLTSTCSLS